MKLGYLISRTLGHLRPRAIQDTKLHKLAKVGAASQIVNSTLGRYTYCGTDTVLINVQVANFTSIADHVVIGASTHPMSHVSMSPVFHRGRNRFHRVFPDIPIPKTKTTSIGNDVWIGYGAKISAGVKIGDGAVIGMGAVVTKDIEPYTIVGGVPAKVIGQRFSPAIISELQALKWWNWMDEKLAEYAHLFSKPHEIIEAFR